MNEEPLSTGHGKISSHNNATPAGTNQETVEDLHEKILSLSRRVSSIETTCAGYKTSLEFTQRQVRDLQEENLDLRRFIDTLELEMNRNTYAVDKLEKKQDKTETTLKRKNLVFEGIAESATGRKNLQDTLRHILVDMGIDDDIAYNSIYRLGRAMGRRPRPVVVSFIRQDARDFIFSRRSKLKDSKDFGRVWVSDDVTPLTRRVKTVVREVVKEAKSQGIKFASTPFTVTIGNTKYGDGSLLDLPKNLTAESVKMKKIGNSVCYHSEFAPFSNLHPALVAVGRHDYMSVEQAYFHIMATHHKLYSLAAKILWSRDPYEIMQLGSQITADEEWNAKAEKVMYTCMTQKFRCNDDLREKLLSTGDMELIEATLNKKWGAAASLNSTLIKSHNWTGDNLQGKLLMKIRDLLRKETSGNNARAANHDGAKHGNS